MTRKNFHQNSPTNILHSFFQILISHGKTNAYEFILIIFQDKYLFNKIFVKENYDLKKIKKLFSSTVS